MAFLRRFVAYLKQRMEVQQVESETPTSFLGQLQGQVAIDGATAVSAIAAERHGVLLRSCSACILLTLLLHVERCFQAESVLEASRTSRLQEVSVVILRPRELADRSKDAVLLLRPAVVADEDAGGDGRGRLHAHPPGRRLRHPGRHLRQGLCGAHLLGRYLRQ